jgi:hypothetical protein
MKLFYIKFLVLCLAIVVIAMRAAGLDVKVNPPAKQ